MADPTEADKAIARRIAGECHCAPAAQCGACKHFYDPILAALVEAREEGERIGAERERRACWDIAERERAAYEDRQPSAPTQRGRAAHAAIFAGLAAGAAFIRNTIAARGPMNQEAARG